MLIDLVVVCMGTSVRLPLSNLFWYFHASALRLGFPLLIGFGNFMSRHFSEAFLCKLTSVILMSWHFSEAFLCYFVLVF